jgi:hypothetical protein
MEGGLRALYKVLELPGNNPLRDAQDALDTAVMDAYGFSSTDDVLAQVLSPNGSICAAADARGPGIPHEFLPAPELVSDDCIQSAAC